jgi:hypothetical protein
MEVRDMIFTCDADSTALTMGEGVVTKSCLLPEIDVLVGA